MNGIYGMELQYESLIPIDRPKDTFLSVGTVTFLIEGKELPLDFTYHGGRHGRKRRLHHQCQCTHKGL